MRPVVVRYRGRPRPVAFRRRPNRFLASVHTLDTREELEVHIPNPGRMEELLIPDITRGWVVPAAARGRRTAHDLVAVRAGRTTVSIDSRVANRLVARVLEMGDWSPSGRRRWRPEFAWSGCRFDFGAGSGEHPDVLLEVKSSNLLVGRLALFPDAPTERGAHHLEVLTEAARRGTAAAVLFVVQRNDAGGFAINRQLDPPFGRRFDEARSAGVRVFVREMLVRPGEVRWGRSLRVADD